MLVTIYVLKELLSLSIRTDRSGSVVDTDHVRISKRKSPCLWVDSLFSHKPHQTFLNLTINVIYVKNDVCNFNLWVLQLRSKSMWSEFETMDLFNFAEPGEQLWDYASNCVWIFKHNLLRASGRPSSKQTQTWKKKNGKNSVLIKWVVLGFFSSFQTSNFVQQIIPEFMQNQ